MESIQSNIILAEQWLEHQLLKFHNEREAFDLNDPDTLRAVKLGIAIATIGSLCDSFPGARDFLIKRMDKTND